MAKPALELYEKHFVQKDSERLDLFEALAARYEVGRVLYPGCFVHVTPSFVFPAVVYVDNDRRCPRFFADPAVKAFIAEKRTGAGEAEVSFLAGDFTQPLDIANESIDLMLSQWTLPTSQCCKRYLRVEGILVANDSHGDASLASLDPDYTLVAVVNLREGRHTLSEENLDNYFVVKGRKAVTREAIESSGRGANYTESPAMYVFRRVA